MEVPIEIIQKILKQPIGSLKLWVRGFHSGRIVEEISECMTIQHWFFGIADSEIEEMKIKRDYVVLRKVFTTDSLKKHGIIVPEKSFVVIEKSVQHRYVTI